MPLDPHAQALLNELSTSELPPTAAMSVIQARQVMRDKLLNVDQPESVNQVEDYFIPCPNHIIPVRTYTPATNGPLPALIFFHGGGWVLGDVDTHDNFCRRLSNTAHCVVIAVDYRLAPEYKFPAGLEDCFTATQWVFANSPTLNIDENQIGVGGDSAGGNLAAVVSLLARDRAAFQLAFQVLIYPITDYWIPSPASYTRFAAGYALTRDTMIWFWNHYLPSTIEVNNPYLCPLRASNFQGLPPSCVITAEYDPLRDEGEAYATCLSEAGIPTISLHFDGMMHGFMLHHLRFEQAQQLQDFVADSLSALLNRSS